MFDQNHQGKSDLKAAFAAAGKNHNVQQAKHNLQ
jgi:hypothetical protein